MDATERVVRTWMGLAEISRLQETVLGMFDIFFKIFKTMGEYLGRHFKWADYTAQCCPKRWENILWLKKINYGRKVTLWFPIVVHCSSRQSGRG